jgi:adenylosuccinate synthase
MQAMADARVPPTAYKRGYLAFRTYPIRVGNVDGHSSGDWYEDQIETSWEGIGQKPEITTVTGRERRVATWSWSQFADAMNANQPTHVFINFMNYLSKQQQAAFVTAHERVRLMRDEEYELLFGFGPTDKDIFEHHNTGEL